LELRENATRSIHGNPSQARNGNRLGLKNRLYVKKTSSEYAAEQNIKNLKFFAFDLTEAMLNIFRQWILINHAEEITLYQADVLQMEKLPPDWSGFDLVVTSAMLEYFNKEEITKAVLNLKSRLLKDGRLILIITKKILLPDI
jgi:ubiquinone/menaquinone biosynthesis C-methylase UbiE